MYMGIILYQEWIRESMQQHSLIPRLCTPTFSMLPGYEATTTCIACHYCVHEKIQSLNGGAFLRLNYYVRVSNHLMHVSIVSIDTL
jgi:hypothetical protein